MKQSKFRTGEIFQIILPNDLGYAFFKIINLLDANPLSKYPALIRVFNYRSRTPETDVKKIVDRELILTPTLVAGFLPAISNGDWKPIGHQVVSSAETIVPEYKKAEPDEANARTWYFLIDADISQKIESVYENVRHLETIGAIGSELVSTKIAMALLRDEGMDIKKYFSLDQFFEKEFYRQIMEIPPYYKLPDAMKGKALRN
jgi:hypothetical protein